MCSLMVIKKVLSMTKNYCSYRLKLTIRHQGIEPQSHDLLFDYVCDNTPHARGNVA